MSSMTSAVNSGPGFSQLVAAVRDVYSQEIYFSAMPNLRFDQFATRKDELTGQPGATIVLPKMGTIKRGGTLTEGVRIQGKSMSMSTTTITVAEKGNAILMTERLLQTSFYDNMAAASMLLGRDFALVNDTDLRDIALTATNKVYAGKKAARTDLVGGDTADTTFLMDIGEKLEINSSPKWGNDFYVSFFHPHGLAKLRQSVGWVNAAHYQGATPLFYGEAGRWNDIRFVSTSMMPNGFNSALNDAGEFADPGYVAALANGTAGNQTTIYQCVTFGEYSYGQGNALNVELRDNGVQDYGREHGLAWYAIWGQGLLENNNLVVGEHA